MTFSGTCCKWNDILFRWYVMLLKGLINADVWLSLICVFEFMLFGWHEQTDWLFNTHTLTRTHIHTHTQTRFTNFLCINKIGNNGTTFIYFSSVRACVRALELSQYAAYKKKVKKNRPRSYYQNSTVFQEVTIKLTLHSLQQIYSCIPIIFFSKGFFFFFSIINARSTYTDIVWYRFY